MINNLRSCSFATRIHVSACSRSSTPFSERDLKNGETYKELNNIDGDTQEMMKYLHSTKRNVCLVSIDFPGLSSRSHQVKELLEKNPSIKKKRHYQIQNCWKNLNPDQDQYNDQNRYRAFY
ncbi:unnamed protein product [Rhizopus stolonifer]